MDTISNYQVNFTCKQCGDARKPIKRDGVSFDTILREAKDIAIKSFDCYTFTVVDTVSRHCQSYSQFGMKLS